MNNINEKEEIIRDLVNTFTDRDELHKAYKDKIKEIIAFAMLSFGKSASEIDLNSEENFFEWIDKFVEKHFKA